MIILYAYMREMVWVREEDEQRMSESERIKL